MWVGSLGREDPVEEGKATHSSILAWRIPWAEESGVGCCSPQGPTELDMTEVNQHTSNNKNRTKYAARNTLNEPHTLTDEQTAGNCRVCRVQVQVSSVQFSRSVVSDSSRPLEPQHARPPCPSPTPGGHSNSRPSSG